MACDQNLISTGLLGARWRQQGPGWTFLLW